MKKQKASIDLQLEKRREEKREKKNDSNEIYMSKAEGFMSVRANAQCSVFH